MRTLVITYDLMRPGQDYPSLIARIKSLGTWCHPLKSTWIIRANMTAKTARDDLAVFIDSGDKMLVLDVTGDATAWTTSLSPEVADWLRANMPLVS